MSILDSGGYIGYNSSYSSSLVTDGLVVFLDGSTSSYPGSGTVWNDLSGNGKNFNLLNAPTFTSNYFTMNGTTQGFDIGSAITTVTNSFTYSMIAMPTATHGIDAESTSTTTGTAGQRYLVGAVLDGGTAAGAGISCGTNGVSVYEHAGGYMPPLLVHSAAISSTTPTLITVTYVNKRPYLYLNNVFARRGLTSPRTAVNMRGDTLGYGAYGYFQGRIYTCQMYSKALSLSEISQNYEFFKKRYAI
jgi:hypothetical protein